MSDDFTAKLAHERNEAILQCDALAKQYDDNLQRLFAAERQIGRCVCVPFPHGSGPEMHCGVHGLPYSEWVERGDHFQRELTALRERLAGIVAKARRTPAANDPYHVAMDIADEIEASW